MSNSLDPDQARDFVGSDLGPNCMQKCSAGSLGDISTCIILHTKYLSNLDLMV